MVSVRATHKTTSHLQENFGKHLNACVVWDVNMLCVCLVVCLFVCLFGWLVGWLVCLVPCGFVVFVSLFVSFIDCFFSSAVVDGCPLECQSFQLGLFLRLPKYHIPGNQTPCLFKLMFPSSFWMTINPYFGLSPLPVTVANEGLVRDPRA